MTARGPSHHHNLLDRLPQWLTRWIGYRSTPPPPLPEYLVWFWSFVGAFGGIAILQAVFGHAPYFMRKAIPPIIASYGASAVLIYGAIEAPLAQPRALIGGHFVGALIGTCVTKLFHLLPTEEQFQELSWLAGSLACAIAVVVMQVTGTTHPPAGATALIAAVKPEVRHMGWYYLPVVLLSSALSLGFALLVNNIQRQYPIYWFTPPTSKQQPQPPHPVVAGHKAALGGRGDDTTASTRVNSRERLPEKVDVFSSPPPEKLSAQSPV
ncbi:hypothetical protein AMATHDRAFT_67717 [Amanita thiersii Skay4041]|uniref:HPP transmembrane region domain-containing protein n=1 Tax=Amanita thiersii Skay4041 TaxID=703135 RepID=A0A2A9NDT4_9AGAR|nr:hypothetical protein AMATHDRAFT_67717 [Amanita thiersii Skay4041]